ncbi:protein LEG1 homolog [Aplochiton taeniatus]
MCVLCCVWVLLVCAVCRGAVIVENDRPILWDKASSQLSELPQADGVTTVNPWDYQQRMSLYRLLISSTDPYMGSMGSNATDSPLWGFPLQLGWKLKSGRLVDPSGATSCGQESGDQMCISPQSWWACVNYFLSVVPFLSAVQQGLMGDGVLVKILVPEGGQDYCSSYTDCLTRYPDPTAKWDTFFQGLKPASESPASDLEKRDHILGLMWSAQQASLSTSSACKDRRTYYSRPERSFADSWLNAADYVAVTRFQSNMARSLMFMAPLPSRVLKEGDNAPYITDLSQEENHALSIFSWMSSMNSLLGGSLVRLWGSAMCSEQTREKGRVLLEQLILDPGFATSTFFSIITEMSTSC